MFAPLMKRDAAMLQTQQEPIETGGARSKVPGEGYAAQAASLRPPEPVDPSKSLAGAHPGRALTGGARPMLYFGSRGDAVVELQSMLNATDEVTTSLGTDGIFGPNTSKAVREFQAANGLAVDGVVGPNTWSRLDVTPAEPQEKLDVSFKTFQRGERAFQKGHYGHAYDLLTAADTRTPRVNLKWSRAECLRHLGGRAEEAVALYQQHIDQGGKHSAKAQAHIEELQGPDSSGEVEADTATARVYFDKGRALMDAGQYAHAYDQFKVARRISGRPGLLYSMAQALRQLGGRDQEAISLYAQYVAAGGKYAANATAYMAELRGPDATGVEAVDTGTARTFFENGSALFDAGDYAHAYDEFMKAHRICGRPGLLYSAAQALRKLGGRAAEAIGLYRRYLAAGDVNFPDKARFYLHELQQQGAHDRDKGL